MSSDIMRNLGYYGSVENFDNFIRTHSNLSIVHLTKLLYDTRNENFAQCIVDNKDVSSTLIGTAVIVLITQKFDSIEVYKILSKKCSIDYHYLSKSLIDENIYTSNNKMFNVCIVIFGKKFVNSYVEERNIRRDLTNEMKEMLQDEDYVSEKDKFALIILDKVILEKDNKMFLYLIELLGKDFIVLNTKKRDDLTDEMKQMLTSSR